MKQSYTEEDLIRFIYQEVEVCEYFEIDNAVESDRNLKEKYMALKETVDSIKIESFNPSINCVQNILAYNRKSFSNSMV